MGCGAFAVGACHMDGAKVAMGMAEQLVHGFAALQPGLVSMGTLAFEDGQLSVEVGEGFAENVRQVLGKMPLKGAGV